MKKNVLKFLEFSILLMLVISLMFYFGILKFNYPSIYKYHIKGIDISHYQKEINWQELKREKISFIYMKATEGADYIDDKFKTNWKSGLKNNYKIGAYHFYLFCKSAIDQANNFISIVPSCPESLPPVIDLEYKGNCPITQNKSEIIKEIEIFIKILSKHYNKIPIIYTTQTFYNDYLKDTLLNNYPIWIRSVFCKSALKENEWLFWQYTNRGKINGIKTFVDLNVFNGNLDDFKKLLY